MSQLYTTPVALAMQPAFPNEEFVDFESAHQCSITSEDWALSELEEAALGMEQKTLGGGGCKARPEVKKVLAAESVPAASTCSPRAVAVMKASMLEASDEDLFGSGGQTRNYSSSFNKTRPTMISAKYRLKEERRKVLKISINKLKKIEDPENSLRRSVLINNTMKRLQREAREERREKQQLHSFPRYTPSYKSFVMREEPPKPAAEEQAKPSETAPSPVARLKPDADKENASPYPAAERKHPSTKATATTLESCFCDETMDELVDVTSLDEELSRPLEELANPVNHVTASIEDVAARCSSRKRSFDEDVRPLEVLSSLMDSAVVVEDTEVKGHHGGDDVAMDIDATRMKRSYEDVEDAEIHDVLSQFYMPPTPRMLTSIDDDDDDEDEEVNVVDIDSIDMPLSRGLSTIVTKTIGFEELVRVELDDEPVSLAKRLSEELAGADLSSPPCKRPRYEAGSPMHATAATPVFGGATHAAVERMYGDVGVLGKSQSFGYLAADMVAEFGDKLARDVAARPSPVASGASVCSSVGSANCGTVSTCLPASGSDACTATAMGARADVEIKDTKNIDFATKESKTVDRRSQITSISEVISWTSLMADARAESQDYKYNTELCKTLSDCCYNQETNNNLAVEPNKLSCAHAAITELQSQVYHNYATSLES